MLTLRDLVCRLLLFGVTASPVALAQAPQVHVVTEPPMLTALPMVTGGRMLVSSTAGIPGFPEAYTSQWPGSYFRATFAGPSAYFRVGTAEEILHVLLDGAPIGMLVKPKAGVYAIGGLDAGPHTVEVQVATESQAAPNTFGGFAVGPDAQAMTPPRHGRQIEFVGDSHTVGYGDLSPTRQCSKDEIWARTDDTKAFGAVVAQHDDAEYQVNAISGRGVVRNYNGFAGPTLPEAYPFVLFDQKQRYEDAGWHPQVVVIALGTNDFSTPLNPGERWPSREALHADFEATYLHFLEQLRARDPHALLVVWATDVANGEVEAEAQKVVAAMQSRGEQHITFVPVNGLRFDACDSHPSLADEATLAGKLMEAIDADPHAWEPAAHQP